MGGTGVSGVPQGGAATSWGFFWPSHQDVRKAADALMEKLNRSHDPRRRLSSEELDAHNKLQRMLDGIVNWDSGFTMPSTRIHVIDVLEKVTEALGLLETASHSNSMDSKEIAKLFENALEKQDAIL